MKRMHLLALLLILACPTPLLAKPVEVLVFPNGAIVTEQGSVAVKDSVATLTLPASAITDSLKIAALDSKATIGGVQFESVLEKSGDYQPLRDKIEATKDRWQAVEDKRQATEQALALWKTPLGEKFATAEEYRKLSELMLASGEKLNTTHTKLVKEKTEIEEELRELQRRLDDATSLQKRHWAVTVALDSAATSETLRYSYRIYAADWQPAYTLDARPQEQAIAWDWTARVSQQTAVDWTDVRLLLATAEPVFTLTPPDIQPWIIREARYYPSSPAPAAKTMRFAEAPMELAANMAADEPAPTRRSGTLFDVYDLGQKSLKAGESYQLDIRKGSWPATFDYLVRPLQSPQAFLLAKLEFDELLPMPSGEAAIQVEGVFVGKREFSLLQKKLELAFGNDPQIEVKVTPTRESDEAGLFGGDKTQAWQWRLDLTNNKNIPVTLRIEDSLPRIEDKRIELVEAVAGTEDKEKHLATWAIELPAGAKKSISYGYTIRYPDEMQVELGR